MADREDLEVHLATCSDCSGELAQYRGLLSRMTNLRHELEQTPPGFTAGVVAFVAAEQGLVERALRIVQDPRMHVAAASVGGALIGAAAIGLIWWRAAHRAVERAV